MRSLIRYDEELLGPKSLLEQGCVLNTLGQRSVVRLTGLMVDGSRLQYTGSAYKDVSVRATLVVRTTAEELKAQEEAANAAVGDEGGDDYEPMALRVMSGNPAMNAKTTTRPRPSSLDWGAEQLTLELPGPVQLPIFVQFLIRAKDANGQAVTLGHALGIIDSLNGSLNVTMIDESDMAEAGYSAPPSPPDSEPPSPPSFSPPRSRPPSPPPSPPHAMLAWGSDAGSAPPRPPPAAKGVDPAVLQQRLSLHPRRPPPLPLMAPADQLPPSPCPSPPGSDRPMTAPDGRGSGNGRGGNGSGSGSDGRPSTAPGGGGEVSQKPILPITTQKPTDLLKVEVEHAYKAVAQGHNAEERKGPDALILRCAYAVSTPFPALSADFLRTRQDESTLRAMNGGVASDDDAGKKPQLTGPPPLGSFAQGLLFDGPACVRELLKHGAPVGGTDLVTSTPLHKAVANGDQRAMQLLLGGGADINFQNMYGDTPVHRAVENSRLYTFTHLQRMGADINRPNKVGNTPLHLAAAIGHVQLVRALLTAGAGVMNYNLRGQVPLHVAVAAGKKEALKEFVAFHNNRKLPWATLCTQASNDTPLHVAVRTLRIPLFVWMVDNGGFSAGMVMKNVENIDPMKHLKKAQGLLKKMQGYQKKVDKADKKGAPKPPMPAAIIPPAPPPPDLRPLAEQMATQKQGSIQAYLMEDPIYVNFHEVPAPPPEPKGKKKKGGGKAKKEKLIPPPPFICTLGQALEVERTERRGAPYIGEKLKDMEKKYEEEKKAAEKIAAEKAKLKAQAEKEAAAKAAKDKPAGKKK